MYRKINFRFWRKNLLDFIIFGGKSKVTRLETNIYTTLSARKLTRRHKFPINLAPDETDGNSSTGHRINSILFSRFHGFRAKLTAIYIENKRQSACITVFMYPFRALGDISMQYYVFKRAEKHHFPKQKQLFPFVVARKTPHSMVYHED